MRFGVEEYYIYDPDHGHHRGWLRQDDRLTPIARMDGHVSPRLGIRFEPGEGPDNLKIVGPGERPLLTYVEVAERLYTALNDAQSAIKEADAARAQAQAAERLRAEKERADRLAARLRELGIEPDQI